MCLMTRTGVRALQNSSRPDQEGGGDSAAVKVSLTSKTSGRMRKGESEDIIEKERASAHFPLDAHILIVIWTGIPRHNRISQTLHK